MSLFQLVSNRLCITYSTMNHSFSQSLQNLSWNFEHPITHQVIQLGEKGSVQEGLIAAGKLPDPYYGLSEKEFGWIENYQWTFNAEFNYSKQNANESVLINFPSFENKTSIPFTSAS